MLKRPLNGICYSPLLTEILRAFHKAGVNKLSCVYKWGTPPQCEPYKGVFPNYSWDCWLNINLHIQKRWGRKTSEKANLGKIAPAMREKESVLFTPGLLRPWYFLFKLCLQEEKCKKAGAASDRREGGGHMCRSCFMFTLYSGSSVSQSCLTLCDPIHCSTPGFPVHHQLPEHAKIHVHWADDAIQPSHLLSFPFLCL